MATPIRRQRPSGAMERYTGGWMRNPLVEFDDLLNQMSGLLESTVGGVVPAIGATAWAPMADVMETDNAYVIEAELPGVKSQDIKVDVHGQELLVSGEIKERKHEGILRRSTRRTGRFEYRVLLPGDVRADDVKAKLRDGVLTVTVPKAEAAKPHQVPIESDDD